MKYHLERRATGNLEKTSLVELAERYRLEMQVAETVPELWPGRRYYARFRNVETMEGGMLGGAAGYGSTPEGAIASYADHLGGKQIAVRAFTDDRVNVTLPDQVDIGDWSKE